MEIIFLFTLGLFVGSFVGVAVERIIRGEKFIGGRSRCDHCRQTLKWFELIPLLSCLYLEGRCRYCRKKIGKSHLYYELGTAAVFASAAFLKPAGVFGRLNSPAEWFLWLFFLTGFLIIFLVDFRIQIIPDVILLPMVLISLISLISQIGLIGTLGRIGIGLGAAGFFLALYLITRGRGMGFGDVKLGFLMGLLLGFPQIIAAVYIAFLTGAAVGVILMIIGRKGLKSKIAFGPFLIIGTAAALIFNDLILNLAGGFF